jgi:hypothetical protein
MLAEWVNLVSNHFGKKCGSKPETYKNGLWSLEYSGWAFCKRPLGFMVYFLLSLVLLLTFSLYVFIGRKR